MLLICIAILIPTLLGYLITTLLLHKDGDATAGLLERLCLAYPLGTGLLTLQMFLLGLLRVPLTVFSITSILLIEIIGLSLWIGKKKIVLLPRPAFGLYKEITGSDLGWIKKTALLILMIWVGAKIVSIFGETYLRPIWAWDAWANWSASAKVFYFSRSLLLDAPSYNFFGANTVSRLLSYPLHNPLMQVWLGLWAGSFDEVLVKFWSPVYLLSMAGYLYNFARREIGRLAALCMLTIVLSSPFMSYHAVEVYSDLPLGVYNFFALVSFLNAMRGKQAYWTFAGAFSTAAILTKNESVGFVFPLLLSAFTYLWLNRERLPVKIRLFQLLAPLSGIIPWFLFKYAFTLSLTQDNHELVPQFHAGVAVQVLDNFFSLQNFNIILLSLPVLLLLNGRPTKELLHILFPVAFYATFFILLYTLITYYYITLLQGTIFYRNVLTYYPAACLVTILALKELIAKTRKGIPFSYESRE